MTDCCAQFPFRAVGAGAGGGQVPQPGEAVRGEGLPAEGPVQELLVLRLEDGAAAPPAIGGCTAHAPHWSGRQPKPDPPQRSCHHAAGGGGGSTPQNVYDLTF